MSPHHASIALQSQVYQALHMIIKLQKEENKI